MTSPRSVNLMALPMRFTNIWRSLKGSPRSHVGTSSAMWKNEFQVSVDGALSHDIRDVLDHFTQIEAYCVDGQSAGLDFG